MFKALVSVAAICVIAATGWFFWGEYQNAKKMNAELASSESEVDNSTLSLISKPSCTLEQIRAKTTITFGRLYDAENKQNSIFFYVKNNLPWTLSGAQVEYEVYFEGKPEPSFKQAEIVAFPNGIAPDTQRWFYTLPFTFPFLGEEPKEVSMRVVDVADQYKRFVLHHPTGGDWMKELSTNKCN